jgi:hypothetical protein
MDLDRLMEPIHPRGYMGERGRRLGVNVSDRCRLKQHRLCGHCDCLHHSGSPIEVVDRWLDEDYRSRTPTTRANRANR